MRTNLAPGACRTAHRPKNARSALARLALPTLAVFWLLGLSSANALTVREYTELPEAERLAYTSGLIDGLSVLASGQPVLMTCLESFTYQEFNDRYDARILAEPHRQRMNGGGMMALILRDICPY